MPTKPKHITYSDAMTKARHYCAYQDRCHFEVEEKLKSWGLHYEFIPTVCVELSSEGYLNEERYVSAYVRGKFTQNKWGKIKIAQGLKSKRVSNKLIEIGLKEIDSTKYFEVLTELLKQKKQRTTAKNQYDLKAKMHQFVLSKGFESNLISDAIDQIL
ncbi:MAG: regulatory protein RecX [Bacteroidia bacterium]